MLDTKIMDTPGIHNYNGFTIVISNRGVVDYVKDNYTGSIVIYQENIQDDMHLKNLLNTIRNSR